MIFSMILAVCITAPEISTNAPEQTKKIIESPEATTDTSLFTTKKEHKEIKKHIKLSCETKADDKQLQKSPESIKKIADNPELPIKKTRTIMLKNSITQDMITYKKGFITRAPDEFKVLFNNKEISRNSNQEIEVSDNRINLSFFYDFKVGGSTYRSGTETEILTIPQDHNSFELVFAWDNPHLTIKNI